MNWMGLAIGIVCTFIGALLMLIYSNLRESIRGKVDNKTCETFQAVIRELKDDVKDAKDKQATMMGTMEFIKHEFGAKSKDVIAKADETLKIVKERICGE